MNKTLTLLFVAGLQLTSITTTSAQPSPHPYNPDSDGDGYVGVSDVLSVLSYFESYYPIYPPSSSSVLLVSQHGCGTELLGSEWDGVTWVEPGGDTLFVPYGYDDVVIESHTTCDGFQNQSPLFVVLLNPPGHNDGDVWAGYQPPYTVRQETRIHYYQWRQIEVISWHVMGGWYVIRDNENAWEHFINSWQTNAPLYTKSYTRVGNGPWSRAD
jgi:hypothetical protein